MELTVTERIALAGLSAIWQQRQQQQQADERALVGEVEKRLALPAGAVGTTHQLDVVGGRVVPTTTPAEPP